MDMKSNLCPVDVETPSNLCPRTHYSHYSLKVFMLQNTFTRCSHPALFQWLCFSPNIPSALCLFPLLLTFVCQWVSSSSVCFSDGRKSVRVRRPFLLGMKPFRIFSRRTQYLSGKYWNFGNGSMALSKQFVQHLRDTITNMSLPSQQKFAATQLSSDIAVSVHLLWGVSWRGSIWSPKVQVGPMCDDCEGYSMPTYETAIINHAKEGRIIGTRLNKQQGAYWSCLRRHWLTTRLF